MARPIEEKIKRVSEGLKGHKFIDAPEINKTTDYKKFNKLKANREVNKTHVLNMMHSIVNSPELLAYRPVLVTENFEVIDGQHTVEACKALKAPIYYLVYKEGSASDAATLNAIQKKWKMITWINHWADRGMESYKELRKFLQKYPMAPSLAASILHEAGATRSYGTKDFQGGRFKITNKEEAVKLGKVLQLIQDQYGKSFAYKQSFVIAFLECYYEKHDRDSFDLDIFLTRLKKASDRLNPARDSTGYIRQIENVYNYHQQRKSYFM